jgi:8-oxo-dGTP diphosphatase
MESFEECAKREVLEEAGIEIENVRFLSLSNSKQYAPKHFVNIGLLADWKSGEAKVMEPEKCESWNWYELDNFPSNLYATVHLYIEAMKTGKNYFDA